MNPITSTTPLDRYPGWTVRCYADGTYDAVNQATALSPGYTSFTDAVAWVREQNDTKVTVFLQATTGKIHRRENCGVTSRTRYSHFRTELTKHEFETLVHCRRCF